jgi:formate-dependent phosphoribosylglycinamide formyltransferase (GAR transformylase)
MLVGNKADMGDFRTGKIENKVLIYRVFVLVYVEEGKEFAKTNRMLFIETSALDSTNVEKAFNILVAQIRYLIYEMDLAEMDDVICLKEPKIEVTNFYILNFALRSR